MERRRFLEIAASTAATTFVAGSLGASGVGARSAFAHATDGEAAAWHAARRFADTPFGRIAYVEKGSGDAALFIHGYPLNGFQWRGAVERLSPLRRCIAPDLLGLGYTEVRDGQLVAPNDQLAMLESLLKSLGVGAVDLFANDSGGAVAQLFAAKHPDRVRSILLTNCDTEPDSPPPALLPLIAMAKSGTYPDRFLAPWVADKSLARSTNGLGSAYTYPDRLSDEAIDVYIAPLVESPRRKELASAYAVALERNPLAGIAPRLKQVKAPVRIVWGTGDGLFSAASPHYLARIFPGSRGVRLVDGAKLFFPEEYPDLIAEEARTLWGVR